VSDDAANSTRSGARGRGRPFQPGRSGNPSGRPKSEHAFKELAREKSPAVLARMIDLALHGRGQTAVSAGKLVLAYGVGPPVVSVDVTARAGAIDARAQLEAAALAALEAAAEALPSINAAPALAPVIQTAPAIDADAAVETSPALPTKEPS
jgi:hypothetical protein